MSDGLLVLTALYVPGDRADRFAKAERSGADAVVVDLEDAVAPAAKEAARAAALGWLAAGPAVAAQVRVNAPGTPWHEADLAALAPFAGRCVVRVPKVETTAQLDRAAALLGAGAQLAPILESARGVLAAPELAAHPAVVAIGLGEADLAADLDTQGEDALGHARSLVVLAARAAGLPAPLMSVWAHLGDPDGLRASCRRGRTLGFLGRSAVHPRQLPVIAAAFRPSAPELVAAREVLDAWDARFPGQAVVTTADGRMVDPAMLPAARRVLAVEQAAARTATPADGDGPVP